MNVFIRGFPSAWPDQTAMMVPTQYADGVLQGSSRVRSTEPERRYALNAAFHAALLEQTTRPRQASKRFV
ncbi:hypothetical protein AVDCRST_MAG81-2371 [uncultured Synechococcales cyanobacterium]|uniref:Uncharacterized protein n=1 Tax=uncultured Synechococcales cyanobacterium TaxID=1936017 RepID=A0A6J4VEH0_9CYAN|nr:hypothetical protein AVDCRST_MAG81-2371 [uncultured Synechococcales cyanobacterium]